MSFEKRKLLLKAFDESQFGYCPLTWMFHGRKANSKINHIHERTLRIVYKNNVLSSEELIELDQSFKMHHRNIQSLAIGLFKIKNDLSVTMMNDIFQPRAVSYNLKVVSATFLLVCFLRLKGSTCETRKNVFYFTSKALFVLEIIKF